MRAGIGDLATAWATAAERRWRRFVVRRAVLGREVRPEGDEYREAELALGTPLAEADLADHLRPHPEDEPLDSRGVNEGGLRKVHLRQVGSQPPRLFLGVAAAHLPHVAQLPASIGAQQKGLEGLAGAPATDGVAAPAA